MFERRIKAARFPVVKSLDSFDFKVYPLDINKALVLELARCEYIERRDEPHRARQLYGTGKTHIALGLGLSGLPGRASRSASSPPPRWSTNSSRPCDDKQLLRFQNELSPPTSF